MPDGAGPSPAARARERTIRLALWLGWLVAAAVLASYHVMWRDEVRALMLAQRGDSPAAMLYAVRGYGHPALWHLLLRAMLALWPAPLALPVTAYLIGAASAGVLALRAPFRPIFLVTALFGGFLLFEGAVVARNYGISALLLFLFAAAYPRYRDVPGVLGLLLALLCNTNIHSVVLAGALLVFWTVDLAQSRLRSRRARLSLTLGAALMLAGTALCLWTIIPPIDDAAREAAAWPTALQVPLWLASGIAASFGDLMVFGPGTALGAALLVLLVLGSVAGLYRDAAAFLAAVTALLGLELIFLLVYAGSYRHHALLLIALLTFYWLARDRARAAGTWPFRAGEIALWLLLAMQLWWSAVAIGYLWRGIPESRSRDLAGLLATPALASAVIMGDPDTTTEALGYYAGNPVYLSRERRFGTVPRFSRALAREPMTLGRLLTTARWLCWRTGRPVVLVLEQRLDPDTPAGTIRRGYYGPLLIRRDELTAFLAATRRLARYGPATSGETFDVWLLRGSGRRCPQPHPAGAH